eukprot:TRINITY_DN2590_c0_g1_i1.p1 TRINITY_DN2590_c0_g1~~TRINITY_DN2590_c0_g1_i1.p1  ORF type:complete len:233 (+),score=32.72 TRINITY_DN2590_c0_g1_i1:135-833(+)
MGKRTALVPEQETMDMTDKYQELQDQFEKIMDETCWCYQCCCIGQGCVSKCDDPMCHGQERWCGMCERFTGTTDCCGGEGCCHDVTKCCCCVHLSSFPPGGGGNDGIPLCALCNMRCGGESSKSEEESAGYAEVAKNTCLLYYCLCFGFGLSGPCSPCVLQSQKCCCITSKCGTQVADEGPCCSSLGKCCCIVSYTTCPPLRPSIGCCGITCVDSSKGDSDSGSGSEGSGSD